VGTQLVRLHSHLVHDLPDNVQYLALEMADCNMIEPFWTWFTTLAQYSVARFHCAFIATALFSNSTLAK
jgi:hypothetical protein